MLANTKQVRNVIRSAMAKVGATAWSSYTNGAKNGPNGPRYVGFGIARVQVNQVAVEARRIASDLGYTNVFRVTLSFTGRSYIRSTTVLA
jgi:hypothetical protein